MITSSVVSDGQEIGGCFHHPIGEKAPRFGLRLGGQLRRIGARLIGLVGGQIALILHQAQDNMGAVLGALQIVGGRKRTGL
jgi:hypothetical protein